VLEVEAGVPGIGGTDPPARRTGRARSAGTRADRVWLLLSAGVLVAGAVLRIRHWVFARSLWNDELSLVFNIRGRGYLGLLHPLWLSQAAPPGWLWLERASTDVFGTSDRALRLVPLLFGTGLLVLLWYLGGMLLSGAGRCAVLALAGFNPFLISYTNQVKQYSSEAFWATAVIGAGILIVRGRPTWRRILLFWGVALVGATLSVLAIPLAALAATVVAGTILARRSDPWPARWRTLLRFAAPAPAWLGAAASIYLAILRTEQANPALKAFWARAYPQQPLYHVGATAHWLRETYSALMVMPFAFRFGWLFALAALFGAVVCLRRSGTVTLVLLLAPVALGLATAAVAAYPLSERLALFAVPTCLLVLAFAADQPAPGSRRWQWGVWGTGLLMVAALLVPQLRTDARAMLHPQTAFSQGGGNLVDYRHAVAYIAANRRPGDLVVGSEGSSWQPMFWYGPLAGVPAQKYLSVSGWLPQCEPDALRTLLRGWKRLWVFEGVYWNQSDNARVNAVLSRYGVPESRSFLGARVVRFDLTGAVPSGPDGTCVAVGMFLGTS
jgi:hypothetical protein